MVADGKSQPQKETEPEFEMMDTGIFDETAIILMYSPNMQKQARNDILIKITVHNRGQSLTAEYTANHLVPEHLGLGIRQLQTPIDFVQQR